jgi:cytochrome c oxidase subunit 3
MTATVTKHLDVSALPAGSNDHHAPIWWGNLLLLVIETTMFALLIATYLYLRQNAQLWPPPRVQRFPVLLDASPSLLVPVISLIILVLSNIPMHLGDRAAYAMDKEGVVRWTLIAVGMSVAVLVLRVWEFKALHFRWDENAYAGIVWTLVGLHVIHVLIAAIEGAISAIWIAREGIDRKHALDVRCSAVYWYWVTGVWLVVFAVVYVSPHLR